MKMQALIIAAALCSGAAFAASPNDTAKAPADTDAKPAMGKSMARDHKNMGKRHAMHHHHSMRDRSGDSASSAPSADLGEQGRQSRMDDALANFRKQHG